MNKIGFKIIFWLPNGTGIYQKLNKHFGTKHHLVAIK